jgi:UV DNA damage repair endonuclease
MNTLNTTPRIGFACKWLDDPTQINGLKPKDPAKKLNTGTTTITWLNRQTKANAEQKLWDLMKHNIESTRLLVEKVGSLNAHLRMVRLSSDILPAFTEPSWRYFWALPDVKRYAETQFKRVGDTARSKSVRLSFHPGQFCVLASEKQDVVNRSIEEFEYHATMAAWLGFGQRFQDFKINVHISGRAGPEGIRQAHKKLSPEARNCITIENEEISYGVDDCLSISDIVPITLDIHHNWIREGNYIQPEDDRVKKIIDSWRGVRPVLHYSVSREDLLTGHATDQYPDLHTLLESGYKKQKLRAHSNYYWNTAVNQWALSFLPTHDIMSESKGKNLASFALANEYFKF